MKNMFLFIYILYIISIALQKYFSFSLLRINIRNNLILKLDIKIIIYRENAVIDLF